MRLLMVTPAVTLTTEAEEEVAGGDPVVILDSAVVAEDLSELLVPLNLLLTDSIQEVIRDDQEISSTTGAVCLTLERRHRSYD